MANCTFQICNILECVYYLATIISAIIIIIGFKTIIHKKKLSQNIISDCNKRFFKIKVELDMAILKNKTAIEIKIWKEQYLNLITEQLFYIQNKYFTDQIEREWIEGISFMLKDEHYFNFDSEQQNDFSLLKNHGRIINAFFPECLIEETIKRVKRYKH